MEIAKNELREDESRKDQALVQFRDWIGKHPAIKYCRTGVCVCVFVIVFHKQSMFIIIHFIHR